MPQSETLIIKPLKQQPGFISGEASEKGKAWIDEKQMQTQCVRCAGFNSGTPFLILRNLVLIY